jgi:hypothetical protein
MNSITELRIAAQRSRRTRVTDDKCRDADQSVGMRRNER